LATSDVRYWVNQLRRCAAWLTDMEEKQTELVDKNKMTSSEEKDFNSIQQQRTQTS